ncbi:uncharacterized protein LOC141912879 [Tubulanus polymorphus]|uniref:uncharacterized protein LOC141912879 n=1 Tax=Tubulanus polymorphus TaxID=672921 RepID=UPI003DA5B5C5
MCFFKVFHTNCPAQIAVWILVLMTLDRAIAVSAPLRAARLCTVGRARTALIAITCVFVIFHVVWSAFHLPNAFMGTWTNCRVESIFAGRFFFYANNVLSLYLPIVLISVANAFIIAGVRNGPATGAAKQATAKKITILVVSTAASFLLLAFFNCLTQLLLLERGHPAQTTMYYLTHCDNLSYGLFVIVCNSVSVVLKNANFVVNGFIFLCSRNFRNDLRTTASAPWVKKMSK